MSQVALLVDDQEAVRSYASAVLRQAGFEVIEAANGAEALFNSSVQSVHGGCSRDRHHNAAHDWYRVGQCSQERVSRASRRLHFRRTAG